MMELDKRYLWMQYKCNKARELLVRKGYGSCIHLWKVKLVNCNNIVFEGFHTSCPFLLTGLDI